MFSIPIKNNQSKSLTNSISKPPIYSNNSSFVHETSDLNLNINKLNSENHDPQTKQNKNDRYNPAIINSDNSNRIVNELQNNNNNLNLQSKPRDDEQFEFEIDKYTF